MRPFHFAILLSLLLAPYLCAADPPFRSISSPRYSPDEKKLILDVYSACYDFDIATGKLSQLGVTAPDADDSFTMLSQDGTIQFVSTYKYEAKPEIRGRRLELTNLATGKTISQIDLREVIMSTPCFSPDNKFLLLGTCAHGAYLYDVATGKELRQFRISGYLVGYAIFSPDGTKILTSSGTDVVLWETDTGKILHRFKSKFPVHGAAFSPDGKQFCAAIDDNIVSWETATGKELQKLPGHPLQIAVSPDGKTLAAAYLKPKEITLWNLATSEQIGTIADTFPRAYFSFSLDSKFLLVPKDGDCIFVSTVNAKPVATLSISGDSAQLHNANAEAVPVTDLPMLLIPKK